MVIAGGVQAAFAKLGIGHDYDYRPYDPYRDPEPRNRLRRVSSHLSVRQRKPSIVENACLSVHKIPAIVAVSGSPDAPTPRVRLPSGAGPSVATRNHRHSIAGWHQLVSEDHTDTDVPVATRGDRSNTTPASINLPPSYDFCDLDRNTPHHSATSQDTGSRIPNIQVTMAGQRPAEARYRHAPPTTSASYDFTDLDRGPPVALPVPRSSSPSPSSIHRSPSPAMGLSYGSISPTLGHMPYYHGPQRHDYSLRTSHTPSHRSITPLLRTDLAPPTDQAAMSGSYDFIGMDQPSPTATHENAEYGAYYCASPMPIFTHGSRHGTSRGNTYGPRRGDTYDATEGGAYALTRDTYDTTQGDIYDPTLREVTRGQQTGLTTIIGEMENYNRAHTSRPVPIPLPSPTATVSADGTLDSPYLDPERDTAFRNRL